MMKIYWKNIVWNRTIRYWHVLKYYKTTGVKTHKYKWRSFFYPYKKFSTEKQKELIHKKLNAEISKLKI